MKWLRLTLALCLATCACAAETKPSVEVSFTEVLKASFSVWDSSKDGTLAKLEIDTALADPTIRGDAAAALAVVKRLNRSKTWTAIPLTMEGVAEVPKAESAPDLAAMFNDSRKRIAAARRELFVEGVPNLLSLHQGKMGNCFSLAPLGCLLIRDPAQVKAMFNANDDGTYDVKIGKKVVRVEAPTDAEIALSSSNESTGLWSNVYEKAAGVARNELREAKDRVTTPLDAIARGGSAGTMLAFITGNGMERFTLKWAKDDKTAPGEAEAKLKELRSKLIAAFAERRCVTTGTLTTTMPGMRSGHAYGVVGYNAYSDEVKTWDPHGDAFTPKGAPGVETGYLRKDGLCEMPLGVFVTQFSGLAFEVLP
jgi:hypothetical protein